MNKKAILKELVKDPEIKNLFNMGFSRSIVNKLIIESLMKEDAPDYPDKIKNTITQLNRDLKQVELTLNVEVRGSPDDSEIQIKAKQALAAVKELFGKYSEMVNQYILNNKGKEEDLETQNSINNLIQNFENKLQQDVEISDIGPAELFKSLIAIKAGPGSTFGQNDYDVLMRSFDTTKLLVDAIYKHRHGDDDPFAELKQKYDDSDFMKAVPPTEQATVYKFLQILKKENLINESIGDIVTTLNLDKKGLTKAFAQLEKDEQAIIRRLLGEKSELFINMLRSEEPGTGEDSEEMPPEVLAFLQDIADFIIKSKLKELNPEKIKDADEEVIKKALKQVGTLDDDKGTVSKKDFDLADETPDSVKKGLLDRAAKLGLSENIVLNEAPEFYEKFLEAGKNDPDFKGHFPTSEQMQSFSSMEGEKAEKIGSYFKDDTSVTAAIEKIKQLMNPEGELRIDPSLISGAEEDEIVDETDSITKQTAVEAYTKAGKEGGKTFRNTLIKFFDEFMTTRYISDQTQIFNDFLDSIETFKKRLTTSKLRAQNESLIKENTTQEYSNKEVSEIKKAELNFLKSMKLITDELDRLDKNGQSVLASAQKRFIMKQAETMQNEIETLFNLVAGATVDTLKEEKTVFKTRKDKVQFVKNVFNSLEPRLQKFDELMTSFENAPGDEEVQLEDIFSSLDFFDANLKKLKPLFDTKNTYFTKNKIKIEDLSNLLQQMKRAFVLVYKTLKPTTEDGEITEETREKVLEKLKRISTAIAKYIGPVSKIGTTEIPEIPADKEADAEEGEDEIPKAGEKYEVIGENGGNLDSELPKGSVIQIIEIEKIEDTTTANDYAIKYKKLGEDGYDGDGNISIEDFFKIFKKVEGEEDDTPPGLPKVGEKYKALRKISEDLDEGEVMEITNVELKSNDAGTKKFYKISYTTPSGKLELDAFLEDDLERFLRKFEKVEGDEEADVSPEEVDEKLTEIAKTIIRRNIEEIGSIVKDITTTKSIRDEEKAREKVQRTFAQSQKFNQFAREIVVDEEVLQRPENIKSFLADLDAPYDQDAAGLVLSKLEELVFKISDKRKTQSVSPDDLKQLVDSKIGKAFISDANLTLLAKAFYKNPADSLSKLKSAVNSETKTSLPPNPDNFDQEEFEQLVKTKLLIGGIKEDKDPSKQDDELYDAVDSIQERLKAFRDQVSKMKKWSIQSNKREIFILFYTVAELFKSFRFIKKHLDANNPKKAKAKAFDLFTVSKGLATPTSSFDKNAPLLVSYNPAISGFISPKEQEEAPKTPKKEQIEKKLEVIIERFINQRKQQWRKRTM